MKKQNGNGVRVYNKHRYIMQWLDEDFIKILKKVQAERTIKDLEEYSVPVLTTKMLEIPEFKEIIKKLINSSSDTTIYKKENSLLTIKDRGSIYDE